MPIIIITITMTCTSGKPHVFYPFELMMIIVIIITITKTCISGKPHNLSSHLKPELPPPLVALLGLPVSS